MTEKLEVIQADREAAAEYGMKVLRWNRDVVDAVEFGRADDDSLIQAFARHRLSHSRETEALIEAANLLDAAGFADAASFLTRTMRNNGNG